jgi:hypothetical protein
MTKFSLCALAVGAALTAGSAFGQVLNRNLGAYHVFGSKSVNLKNYTLLGACNIGVDCAKPSSNSDCGVLSQEDVFYADGSQAAGDNAKFTKAGASVWQLFSNDVGSPGNVTVRAPGGTSVLTPLPIIGDRDNDSVASCRTVGGQCETDEGDLEVACGLPAPFPPCNPFQVVHVAANADCAGAADPIPGNSRCDLAPGVYGPLDVENKGKVTLAGGLYVFCSVNVGKNTSIIASSPATILTSGDFLVNNEASLGQQCGDITVLAKGPGAFGFGRSSSITGFFCAPSRLIALGHDNDLTGQFIAEEVNADSNDRGHCCAPADDCSCIDSFFPTTASVGTNVSLRGGCPLSGVTLVKICGIVAPIVSETENEVVVTVPPGAAGACPIEVHSISGIFHPQLKLTVN